MAILRRIGTGVFIKVSVATTAALIFLSFSLQAQNRSKGELERERQENLNKIAVTEKVLSETALRTRASLGQLNALNTQIEAREKLIATYNEEIALLDQEIAELDDFVHALQNDLDTLTAEYAAMLYAAQKASKSVDRLTFLFASSSFNQFFMRLEYMTQYSNVRENQVEQIRIVKDMLIGQQEEVSDKRIEKEALRDEQVAESERLLNAKTKQGSVIADLKQREKELKDEIENRRRAVTKLDAIIAELVRREAAAANATADVVAVSKSFRQSRNKLPWPVASGFISQKFGRHPHPVQKYVTVENLGVSIQTTEDAKCRAVYEGTIVQVVSVPGKNNAVLVKHGEYFTLYVRLQSVNVSRGDTVQANDVLGTVYTDKDGVTELEFQLWRGQEKLDPAKWLKAQ